MPVARMLHGLSRSGALAVLLAAAGCGHASGFVDNLMSDPKELDARDVKAAVDARDSALLAKMCNKEVELRTYDGREAACAAKEEMAYSNFKALTDCDAIEKQVNEGELSAKDFVSVSSSKLAKCGRWDTVFVTLIHRESDSSSDGGPDALDALTKEGYDVEKEFFAFLERHADKPMSFKHSNYAALHVSDWLQKNRPAERCEALVPYAARIEERTQIVFYSYFAESKCTSAAAMMTAALASDDADVRRAACRKLGTLGDAAVLSKLQLLADNDPVHAVQEERRGDDTVYVKVYPVRDACAESANKIALRSAK